MGQGRDLHEGYPVDLDKWGEEAITVDPTQYGMGCSCGWVSTQRVPIEESLGGGDDLGPLWREWENHVYTAIPALRVDQLTGQITELNHERDRAVITARIRGASWHDIARAAGITRQSAHTRWATLVDRALTPIPLERPDTEPTLDALDTFGREIATRTRIAKLDHGGHPLGVWSTSEQLAVALTLRHYGHIRDMGYTENDAVERIESGGTMHHPDFIAWLDAIRVAVNTEIAAAPNP